MRSNPSGYDEFFQIGLFRATSEAPETIAIDHVIEATILATIEREQRKVDEAALVWGNSKVLGTWVEKLAGRPQSFTITVSP